MKNAKKKAGVLVSIGFVFCLTICFFIGRCSADRGTDTADSDTVERYEERSSIAEESASRAAGELSSLAEQMQQSGEQLKRSITDVGEISSVSVRIAENSRTAENTASRIEEGISAIERILDEAETKDIVLEKNIGNTGGNCSR